MKRLLTHLLFLVLLPCCRAQSMEAQVTPRRVYVDEPVTLHVRVHNCTDCDRPELPASYGRDFVVEARAASTQMQVTMVQGRMTRVQTVTYPWVLSARKSGLHELAPITLPSPNGGTLQATPPTVQILPPDEHDELFLAVVLQPSRGVREQRLTLKLEIGVKASGAGDPLARLGRPLSVELPWLQLGEDFETQELHEWLQPLLADRGSFNIGGITVTSGGFFASRTLARFVLPSVLEERPNPKTGEPTSYWIYSLSRTVTPLTTGTRDLGRVVLRGVYDRRPRYLISESVVLSIGDVPRTGRPASWTGAIGPLEVQATADPVKVRVGDPIALVVQLGGKVRVESVSLPDVGRQEAFAENFKVYQEQSGAVVDGWKQFKLTIRSTSATVTEIPAIELATYDTSVGGYRVVATDPIPIEVETSELLDPTDVIAGEGTGRRSALERSTEGIQANHAGARVHEDHGHDPRKAFGAVVLLFVVWVVVMAIVGRHRRLHQDPAQLRRRGAGRRAKEALAAASDAGAMAAAISGYIADMRDVPAEGLTARDASSHLANAGVASAEAETVAAFLESCEAARYGGSAGAVASRDDSAAREAAQVLVSLERLLAVLLLAVGAVSLAPAVRAAAAEAHGALILEADTAFHEAREQEEFLAAAARYRRALAAGSANGHVYYNLGNAYARGGEVGQAIAAYEVALRYLPRDPDVIENLRVLRSRCVDGLERPGSVAARVLFWQPWLGVHEHARAVLLLALVAFVVACLRVWKPARISRGIVAVVTVIAVLQIVAYTQLLIALGDTHGVVTASEVVARKGPGEGYEPAFQKPIHEGAPFLVRERRAGWLSIELPGGQHAWLLDSEASTF